MLNNFYDKFVFTNGLKYRHNNFFLVNLPFVIAPTEILIGLLETDDDEFARNLYTATKDAVWKHLMRQFGIEFGLQGEKMLNFLIKYFTASGWGNIACLDVDFKGKKAIVKATNNPLGARLHEKLNKPVDHLLRGILAGIFSKVFDEEVDCVELHCMAQGEHDCEFIIKRQHEFDIANKEVRRQLELEV